jgi:hypothetical protein
VAFLQDDAMMVLTNNVFYRNYAMRASLFFLYNSQNDLMLSGGQIRENGFPYRENQRALEILRNYVSTSDELKIPADVEYVEKVMFANNR